MLWAFGDESCAGDGEAAVYVTALIEVQERDLQEARDFMLAVAHPHARRIHFHEETQTRRQRLIEHVLNGPWGFRVIAVRTSSRAQERARRKALVALMSVSTTLTLAKHQAHEHWMLESRGTRPDRRDIRLAASLSRVPGFTNLRVMHARASAEPILWAADIVAGACSRAIMREQHVPFPFAFA